MRSLPLLDELEGALASGNINRRIDILTRITDLFINGANSYSEDQVGVFDDIMARLVNTIEAKVRAKLAHRLAPIANAPTNVIHMLAFDNDIEVASPVLAQSPRLDDRDLVTAGRNKSQQHLFAIAQRLALSETVTDVLVERGDRDVVHSVVRNVGARFSDAGFRMLVRRAAGDDALATEVGLRSDIPRQHFLVLLDKASSAVRQRLAAENPQAAPAIDGVVAEVVGGIRSEVRNASPDFAAAQTYVERLNRIQRIGESKSINSHATENSRRPRSHCRSCATPRSTSSSARCSIRAPRSSSFSPRWLGYRRRPPKRCCCSVLPTVACRRKTSNMP